MGASRAKQPIRQTGCSETCEELNLIRYGNGTKVVTAAVSAVSIVSAHDLMLLHAFGYAEEIGHRDAGKEDHDEHSCRASSRARPLTVRQAPETVKQLHRRGDRPAGDKPVRRPLVGNLERPALHGPRRPDRSRSAWPARYPCRLLQSTPAGPRHRCPGSHPLRGWARSLVPRPLGALRHLTSLLILRLTSHPTTHHQQNWVAVGMLIAEPPLYTLVEPNAWLRRESGIPPLIGRASTVLLPVDALWKKDRTLLFPILED